MTEANGGGSGGEAESRATERYMSKGEYVCRVSCTVALTAFGVLACLFAAQLLEELLLALRFPVRSLKHRPVEEFEAPGILVFSERARLESCGHFNELQMEFWNNASDWNLQTINCSFVRIRYDDPHSLRPNDSHAVTVFRGPSQVKNKETVFLHFVMDCESQDFYTMPFLLFHNYSHFISLPDSQKPVRIASAHAEESVHTASAGLRLWSKITMTQLHLEDGEGPPRTVLDLENSLAASYFSPDGEEGSYDEEAAQQGSGSGRRRRRLRRRRKRQLVRQRRKKPEKQFFLFFEWKSGILAESHVIRTQSVWSVGASLCGVLLTLHKGYSLAAANVRRLKRTRDRRHRSLQAARQHKKQSMRAMMREIASEAGGSAAAATAVTTATAGEGSDTALLSDGLELRPQRQESLEISSMHLSAAAV